MADYKYRPRHEKATRTDRMRIRPFEHWAAWLNMILGAVFIIEASGPRRAIFVYLLPDIVFLVCGGLLLLAGVASLAGLQWPRETMSIGWAVERTGWAVSFFGWIGCLIVIFNVSPFMIVGALFAVFMAGTSALRFDLLDTVEKDARIRTGKGLKP